MVSGLQSSRVASIRKEQLRFTARSLITMRKSWWSCSRPAQSLLRLRMWVGICAYMDDVHHSSDACALAVGLCCDDGVRSHFQTEETPLDLSTTENKPQVVELVINANANIHVTDTVR
jgi:hypothetical protein